ncbi:Hypothetical predicted protein [Octopus vulgaris]|uniref:RNase NYN domain-containing protein n=1 Tax=Octopus vulgaris TaxID=6645 RepID=A0AA36FG34_OCTVU|nr:Hypothetical predicted protein [Octopus vulgaris]
MAQNLTKAADFIVENKHLNEIEKNRSKIENYFNIKLYDTISNNKENKNKNFKWIRLEGDEDEDCRNAKEYILAITDPAETKYMTVAKEIQSVSNWKYYLETIEKQTRAYIEFFRENFLKICGSSLSVALALSILEDKLGPYQQLTSPQFKSGDVDEAKGFRSSALAVNHTAIVNSIMKNNVQLPDLIASSGFRSDNDANCKLSDEHFLENLVISNGASSTPPQCDPVSGQLLLNKPFLSRKEALSAERLDFFRNLAKQIGHEDPDIQDALKIASEDTKPSDFIRLLNSIKEDREIAETEDCDCEEFHATESQLSAKSSLPDSYVKMLLNDYEEESELSSIDELKRRNQARQRCLREHTLNGKSCPVTPPQQPPFPQIEHLKMKKTKKKTSKQPENFANPSPTYPIYPQPPPLLGTDRDTLPSVANPQIPSHQLYLNRDADNQYTPCYKGTPPKASSTSASMAKSKNIPAAQSDNRRTASNVQQPKPLIERIDTGSPNSGMSPVVNDKLRYIVVDGSNIAMTHGNGKFSCRGIQIVVNYFISLGHNVMAFVPQHKFYTPNSSNNILDQDILYRLKEQGHLAVTPSRKIQKKLINCYDDRFILDLAEREDGIVVSNDQYRDLIEEKPSWREIIEKRLLMYTFVQDNFMLPADPLGRDGPTLEEFLSKTPKETNSTPKKSSRPPARQSYNYSTVASMRTCPQGVQRSKPSGIRPQATNSHLDALTLRTKEESEMLYRELKAVFPEDSQDSTLWKILDDNPTERNLMQLSDKFLGEYF